MKALYSERLGLAPVKDGDTADDADLDDGKEAKRPVKTPSGGDSSARQPLNQILYGPPGTGKTYATIDATLAILDPEFLAANLSDRKALKARFDVFERERRVRFVTFHQSFSYEDFVEGLRATTSEDIGQIRYEVEDGVFKSLCEAAAAKVTRPQEGKTPTAPFNIRGRRIWKMSLGNTLGSDAAIYDECIEKGYALLGYGGRVNFTGCTSRDEVLKRCVDNGIEVANPLTDYTVTSVASFVTRMKQGDLVVISDGNFKFRAIGEVSGEYRYQPHSDYPDGYSQMRPVNWLRIYEPSLPHGELMKSQFSQMTLYELRSPSIDLDKLQALLNLGPTEQQSTGGLVPGPVQGSTYEIVRTNADIVELKKPQGRTLSLAMSLIQELAQAVKANQISVADIREKRVMEKLTDSSMDPYLVNGYNNVLAPLVAQFIGEKGSIGTDGAVPTHRDARVLIIDEINRGNISRIFGELITLIEPSKRAGAAEALEVLLPYSKKPFSVPANVYLIGTMNTADRSLAAMDVALRRRFVFREMPPRPGLLQGVEVGAIKIDALLMVMNQRIEALLGRDHCLGHAYFLPLREDDSLAKLAEIFRVQVLPLLQEYYFDDWQRIQWVLNDHRKGNEAYRFVTTSEVNTANLFGDAVNITRSPQLWRINEDSFLCEESYLGVINHEDAST
ncbi:MAG: ATPase [Burkholderiales bacterium]|nr:MAG: ATPase [Burkholderiales bacterium]